MFVTEPVSTAEVRARRSFVTGPLVRTFQADQNAQGDYPGETHFPGRPGCLRQHRSKCRCLEGWFSFQGCVAFLFNCCTVML